MTDLGNWFYRKQAKSEERLTAAATTIGAFSYYSGVEVIDMLGLTDGFIAHNPKPIEEISGNEVGWKERNYNIDYIIRSKPDYIIFSTESKPSAYAERALFTSKEFLLNYYCYYIITNQKVLAIYKRKPDNFIKTTTDLISKNSYSFISLYSETLGLSNDDDIIKNCNKLIEISPPFFSPPYHILGQKLEKRGDINNALKYYNKALEIDEFNFVARMHLAGYYRDQNDNKNMSIHLSKIKEYFPDYYSYLVLPKPK